MKTIAAALLAARAGGPLISIAEQGARKLNLADAYAIQGQVCPKAGPIGGWKVGAAGPEADPIWAPIFAGDIVENGTDLTRAAGSVIGIEVEIAFRISGGIDARTMANANPRDFLDEAYLVIEYVESRLENPADATDGWKLADNQINGGLVIGDAIPGWRDADLKTQPVRLMVNDNTIIDETRANPGGDPYRLMAWTAKQGRAHCGGLAAGQVVTTGSLTGIGWYEAGMSIRAELPGLGVAVSLDL